MAREAQRGFSLVEVMTAIAIIAVILSGLLAGQLESNRIAAHARNLNSAKVVLRTFIDRAQTVAREDALLSETYPWGDSPLFTTTNMDDEITDGEIILYDENPDLIVNGEEGSGFGVPATVERAVSYADGSQTTTSALVVVTFRITFKGLQSSPTSISMSTNRAVP